MKKIIQIMGDHLESALYALTKDGKIYEAKRVKVQRIPIEGVIQHKEGFQWSELKILPPTE